MSKQSKALKRRRVLPPFPIYLSNTDNYKGYAKLVRKAAKESNRFIVLLRHPIPTDFEPDDDFDYDEEGRPHVVASSYRADNPEIRHYYSIALFDSHHMQDCGPFWEILHRLEAEIGRA